MEKRIVFLASGRGSNFQVIMEKIKEKQIKANPISLITDNPDAFCLETAKKFNLSSRILSYKNYPKLEFNEKLEELIDKDKPDLIVAAGFMKILPNSIVSKYRYKIINIHPSLLPSFPGLHAQQQAHSYGVKFSGCTTHFVDEGVDTGPIIMQEIVPIVPNMTEEDLTKAILVKEHQIFPKTIQYFCEDKIVVSGRKCNIKNMKARNLYFTKFSEAEREISSLKDKKIQTYGKWSYYQILTHLADGLEYTLKGENPKWYFPVIIQNTIGKLMLNRILRQKSMPLGLPNLIKKNTIIYGDEKEAYKRLIKVMEEFKSFSGEFKPHPVFWKNDKRGVVFITYLPLCQSPELCKVIRTVGKQKRFYLELKIKGFNLFQNGKVEIQASQRAGVNCR